MTWIPDLSDGALLEGGPSARAIGWLDPPHRYPTGPVPECFVAALQAFRALAGESEKVLALGGLCILPMGWHVCGLCPNRRRVPVDGRKGWRDFAVPFGNLLFVCPELVTHYVGTHGYRPPDEFIEAVLTSPLPGSDAYASQVVPIRRKLKRYGELKLEAAYVQRVGWVAKAVCPGCGQWSYWYRDGLRASCRCGLGLVSRIENPDRVALRRPRWIIVMGAAGAGKSTVADALAERLSAEYLDADDLHTPANVAKMRRGEPLSDVDRHPWLAALHDRLAACVSDRMSLVSACSALRAAHRRQLCEGLGAVEVVYLRATREVLAARLAARRDHFFPTSLLDSQLAALEEPDDALVIDATLPPEAIVARIVSE